MYRTLTLAAALTTSLAIGGCAKDEPADRQDSMSMKAQNKAAMKLSAEQQRVLDDATADWPKGPKTTVDQMVAKYGPPSGVTENAVAWHNPPAPWHKIVVYKETIDHNWPAPHQDYLEQVVLYPVPEDKFDDLAMYDGSVIAERTAGTLAARCHTEWANLIALNLAHDVIEGTKSVEEARAEYAKAAMQKMKGTGSPDIAESLMFEPVSMQKARHPAEPAKK